MAQTQSGIKVSPNTRPRKRGHRDLVLHVEGCSMTLSKTAAALFVFLYERAGQVIPYDRFSQLIGADCTRWKGHNLLATYMTRIREELKRSGTPYALATSREFGYALCKIA
jgi:DNA-binding response OmpR family regulator